MRWLESRLGPDAITLLFVGAAFVVLRVYALIHAKAVPYADTASYYDLNFLGHAVRTWGLPLFWKLAPGGATSDALMQVLVATLAWLFLAATVYRLCRTRRVGVGGFALVLLTGLSAQITEWDMALLSESFTLSLLVVLIAMVMLVVDRLTPARAIGLAVVLCWWTAVRPSNFTILAVIVIPIAIGLALTRRRQWILWVMVPMLVITVWAAYSTSRDKIIWPQNSTGVVQDRLLKDPAAKEFLHEHGMPRSALVEQEKSKEYIGYDAPLAVDPEFRAWMLDRFQPTYLEYLVRHPSYLLGNPIKAAPELITARTGYSAATEVLPVTVKSVLWPHELDLPFLLVAVATFGLFALFVTRAFDRLAVPLAAQAIGWIWVIVTWHLASPDLKRILAPASTLVHVSAVLIVIFSIDALLAHRRRRAAALAVAPGSADAVPEAEPAASEGSASSDDRGATTAA